MKKGIMQKLYQQGLSSIKSHINLVPSTVYDDNPTNQVDNLLDFSLNSGWKWWSRSETAPYLIVQFRKRSYRIKSYILKTVTDFGNIASFPTKWEMLCITKNNLSISVDNRETEIIGSYDKYHVFPLKKSFECSSMKIIQYSNNYGSQHYKGTFALKLIDFFGAFATIHNKRLKGIPEIIWLIILITRSNP